MRSPEKNAIQFDSADGKNTIAGYFYDDPEQKPFCIVQISHGMCEHIDRYDDFAFYLVAHGVAVCGNDHIGHGQSASEEDYGYFGEKGGRKYALLDLKEMNRRAKERWPGVPLILLGHSMGSFFARQYAADWPDTIDGLIISGTGGPNPLAGIGISLAALMAKLKGPRYRSHLVHNMAFGAYLKRIPDSKTPYDWISRDDEIVAIYADDPRCTFRFTVNGFHELFSALRDVSSPEWATRIAKDMPVMLFSGDADPVGDYGRGVETVHGWLRGAGVKNIDYKMYPDGRHEMLNELNRNEVYADVLQFLQTNFAEANNN